MALNRLRKELNDIMEDNKNCSENISAGPIDDNDLFHWSATLIGAVGTPYEGGLFKLLITFPDNYPIKQPIIKFKTKIYHPNINESGEICLDILKYKWSPALTITGVLLSILSLLSDPNPDDPLNPDAAHLYTQNRLSYDVMVRKYVNLYATDLKS